MKPFRSIFLVFVAFGMSLSIACYPVRFSSRPGVSGQVVDSYTMNGVAGAKVTLVTQYNLKGIDNTVSTTTKSDGSFYIPPLIEWGIYIIPGDPAIMNADIAVESAGYVENIKSIRTHTFNKKAIEVGTIPLKRAEP